VTATRGKPIGEETTESSDANLQDLASPPEGGIVGGRSDALAEQDNRTVNRDSMPEKAQAASDRRWVICSECHRAYLANEFRQLVEPGGFLRICPYPNCNSLADSAFPWAKVRAAHPEYPETPFQYVPYRFSEAELGAVEARVSSPTPQAGTVNKVPIASSAQAPLTVAKAYQPAVADVTWTETEGFRGDSATMMFFGLLVLFTVVLVVFANPSSGPTSVPGDLRIPVGGIIVLAWLTWRILRWVEPRNGKVLLAGLLALMWAPGVWVGIRLVLLITR
jgi:hypothetical protein